jgi:hypothetical protein
LALNLPPFSVKGVTMRLTAIALSLTLLAVVPASAQAPAPAQAPPVQHPYGLDPYKPSDAALLRNYGATLVAQTPLLELAKLDPYKPSDAALLRQIGGAIPLWGLVWYPAPSGFAPLTPFPATGTTGENLSPAGQSADIIGIPPNDRLPPARVLPDRIPEHDPLPRLGPQSPARTLQANATGQ